MARYRVLAWRSIPSLIEVQDGAEVVGRALSPRFQELIDAVAMREGASETDAYLDGWARGPEHERAGSAAEVADAVAAELESGFADLVTRHLGGPSG